MTIFNRKSSAPLRACVTLCSTLVLLLLGPAVSSAQATCPNEAIRSEQHSTYLPECRAYEQVSPVEKYGWPLVPSEISADGYHAIAFSLGTFAGSDQRFFNYYELTRGSEGWQTGPLNTPAGYTLTSVDLVNVISANSDMSRGLFEYSLASNPDRRDARFYLRDLPTGPPEEVGPLVSPSALEENPETNKAGEIEATGKLLPSVSGDLTHVVYPLEGPSGLGTNRYRNYLWPGDGTVPIVGQGSAGFTSLYEYIGTGNSAPALVGVDDEGHQISQCGTGLGYPKTFNGEFTSEASEDVYNAISYNGSRVFFTAAGATKGPSQDACTEGGAGSGPAANELFARLGGAKTVPISEPTATDCSACNTSSPADAIFQGASEDGSKVFFLTTQKLLGTDSTQNLYEYDFGAPAGQSVTRVSAGAPSAGVLGVARVSEDGSRVYFVATGKLTAKANGVGKTATAGKDNLYVYDTVAQKTQFIATLSATDSQDWSRNDNRPADATPDGRFLAFQSSADLTPDDSSSVPQVFEYDASARTLVRVSVGDGGFNNDGNTNTYPARIVNPEYNGVWDATLHRTSVGADGSVAFESADGLTPEALNGVPIDNEGDFAPNVYSYHEGRVSLISDGHDLSLVNFQNHEPSTQLAGVSASGFDIFFTTADRLAPQDGDTTQDLYDARIGGGFPLSPAESCSGDSCQGAPTPLSPNQTPGSSTISGSGNPPPSFEKLHPRKKHHRKHKRRARAYRGAAKR
jgi:hypothetical protein